MLNIGLKLSLSQYSPSVLNSLKICKSSSVSQVSYATVFQLLHVLKNAADFKWLNRLSVH